MNTKIKTQDLREQISKTSKLAATRLKKAGVDDAEILTLTRQDLYELLPEVEHFQNRRKIMDIIKSFQEPNSSNMDSITKTPQDMIPKEHTRTVTENVKRCTSSEELQVLDVLHDHRHILKDLEKQLLAVLGLLRPQIELLDKLVEGQQKEANWNSCKETVTRVPPPSIFGHQLSTSPQMPCPSTVKIHTIVNGVTLNAHLAFLNGLGLQMEECTKEECRVVLIFCPISSRIWTDIEAALSEVPKDKDAILVVMHHTLNPDRVRIATRTPPDWKNVVETVDCLFHDTAGNGLVNCTLNKQAILRVHSILGKYM